MMKHAIIAIEDRRFYTNSGVDLRGIARAAVQDVTAGEAVQGASTIPQQFVKISLAAENERTVFQKLREAALAYHLTRRWTKDQILRNYLNSIYFGNGAYGIESAARTYFSYNHDGCGGRRAPSSRRCASVLLPHEAALLAAMVASPSAYDPVQHPVAAKQRRDLVLLRMFEQGYLTRAIYESEQGRAAAHARRPDLPEGGHGVPVLHLLDQAAGRRPARRRPAGRAAGVRGRAAGQDDDRLAPAGRRGEGDRRLAAATRRARAPRWWRSPTRTAWCGRCSAATTTASRPFNLATQGQRQPGSSFKPFVLAEALKQGISPQLARGSPRSSPTSSRAASASRSTTTRTPTPA